MPESTAFLPAVSAATWAAKGVDFRLPLKFMEPAEDQAITFPLASVTVTRVLLKVHWIWTTPFRGAFFPFLGPAAAAVFSSLTASFFGSTFSATLFLLNYFRPFRMGCSRFLSLFFFFPTTT